MTSSFGRKPNTPSRQTRHSNRFAAFLTSCCQKKQGVSRCICKKMLRIAKCVWFKRLDWLFRAPITIGNTILVASTILPPWDRKFSPMGNFGYSLLLFQIPHAIDLLTSILLLMLTLRTQNLPILFSEPQRGFQTQDQTYAKSGSAKDYPHFRVWFGTFDT